MNLPLKLYVVTVVDFNCVIVYQQVYVNYYDACADWRHQREDLYNLIGHKVYLKKF